MRETGYSEKTQTFLEARLGKLRLQVSSFARVEMELPRAKGCPARLIQAAFSSELAPLETSSDLWAARHQLLSPEDILRCQCKLGGLRRLVTESRPDICPRPARLASKVNSFQGSDISRINDLIKTVHVWQPAAISSNASSTHPNEPPTGGRGRPYTRTGREDL